MTISSRRTEQLYLFCHVTGFTSDFLSFIVVEHIRFFHGALQLRYLLSFCQVKCSNLSGIIGLTRGLATLSKGNREPLVVSNKL